jgi:uncharacterized protein with gpF-like domain
MPSPREAVKELSDWTTAQAELVYANNVKTAYAAGAWTRISHPDVARVLPGMKFVSACLATTRPNHRAAHGLVAPTDSPLWDTFGGLLGHGCRCSRREVSYSEAKRNGWLDENGKLMTIKPPGFEKAGPDPGFGVIRPDKSL